MAQYEIDINNCGASNNSLTVKTNDQVKFCNQDGNTYHVTGLGNVFSGASGKIDIPPNGCTSYYTVNGVPGTHGYNIGPNCPPQGTPDIIIDNSPGPLRKASKGKKR